MNRHLRWSQLGSASSVGFQLRRTTNHPPAARSSNGSARPRPIHETMRSGSHKHLQLAWKWMAPWSRPSSTSQGPGFSLYSTSQHQQVAFRAKKPQPEEAKTKRGRRRRPSSRRGRRTGRHSSRVHRPWSDPPCPSQGHLSPTIR